MKTYKEQRRKQILFEHRASRKFLGRDKQNSVKSLLAPLLIVGELFIDQSSKKNGAASICEAKLL
jgi:hypothetical protein